MDEGETAVVHEWPTEADKEKLKGFWAKYKRAKALKICVMLLVWCVGVGNCAGG